MNNNYYQSDIKTSRQEDGIYAIKYASQQILIDKLQQKLEAYENMRKELIQEFNFYETTEFGIKGYEILEKFRNILNKVGGNDE